MKKILLYIVLVVAPLSASGQLIPRIRLNPGSVEGSGEISAIQLLWRSRERRVIAGLTQFSLEYNKRAAFYTQSAFVFPVVQEKIAELQERATDLVAANDASSFIYIYKKPRNRQDLEVVIAALDNIALQMTGLGPNIIYGELANLQQNVEVSLEELGRKLDDIESSIGKSNLLVAVIESLK